MRSVLGTILDPAADKTLMTTLVVALAYKDLLPGICLRLPPSTLGS
jgi:cardiolipin synthase